MARPTQVTATAVWGADRYTTPPGMENKDAWTVTLRYAGRRLTVPFYMGYGHSGRAPTASDVLTCLLSDAAMFENTADIYEFAREAGCASAREARFVYAGVKRNTDKLQRFLGDEYEAALWNGEAWAAAHVSEG